LRIYVGADHRGFHLKERLVAWLRQRGHEVEDLGTHGPESTDYPDYAFAVARRVAAEPGARGLLICSNGVGMAMAANKVRGIRAALCCTRAMAEQSRRHNDANVLCLGADNQSPEEAEEILEGWLTAAFEGGRHERRVRKMMAGEEGHDPAGA
jgi:ribose 5-phosphate isomerase B